MKYQDNRYLDLTTYPEIYIELIYQRNATIDWISAQGLLKRDKLVQKSDKKELARHQGAIVYRPLFRESIMQLLDRLYTHDATEAMYDFESVELKGWSETEANWLERELEALQNILTKLEIRYKLQYKLIFEYEVGECVLYLNRNKILACGQTTLRHKLLAMLYSNPKKQWFFDYIE
jgi:hypothetical protein